VVNFPRDCCGADGLPSCDVADSYLGENVQKMQTINRGIQNIEIALHLQAMLHIYGEAWLFLCFEMQKRRPQLPVGGAFDVLRRMCLSQEVA
jgi:hypothetical protein